MTIMQARADLRADLTPLEIDVLDGPLDKSPMYYPAVVILPPRTGPWVEPGKTFKTTRYHFDVLYMIGQQDNNDVLIAKIANFITAFSELRSTWVYGFSVESPYVVTENSESWYELMIHVSNEREG